MKALVILVAVMLPLATAAAAQERPSQDKQSATFAALDRNRDQSIDKLEAKADRTIAAVFDTADVNLDGYITKSEYAAYLQRASGAPPKQE